MKTFKGIDYNTQVILMFNQWIMYTMKPKSDDKKLRVDYYTKYKFIRFWCSDIICGLKGMYETIPEVNEHNEAVIFERCFSKIDLKKFKEVSCHEFNLKVDDRGLIYPVII